MATLTAVVLHRQHRGFLVATPKGEHHYPPATARKRAWYPTLSCGDRSTVDAWLTLWARKAVQ